MRFSAVLFSLVAMGVLTAGSACAQTQSGVTGSAEPISAGAASTDSRRIDFAGLNQELADKAKAARPNPQAPMPDTDEVTRW